MLGWTASQISFYSASSQEPSILQNSFTSPPLLIWGNNNSRQLPELWAGVELIGKRLKEREDSDGSPGVPMVNCGQKEKKEKKNQGIKPYLVYNAS